MNSNNYIRKIDDLGRIVIPKEVRQKLKIQDNENILISCDDSKINISKYSYLHNYTKFLQELGEILSEIYKCEIIISDREKIIFSNFKNNFQNKFSDQIIKDSIIIGEIELYTSENTNYNKLTKLVSKLISIFLTMYICK